MKSYWLGYFDFPLEHIYTNFEEWVKYQVGELKWIVGQQEKHRGRPVIVKKDKND